MMGNVVHRAAVLSAALGSVLAIAIACAPASPQQQSPAAAPAKSPAQQAEPAKPAAQPAKPATQSGAAVVELRAGLCCPKGSVQFDAVQKFTDLVNEKGKGELVVRNFGQALGVEQQLLQAMMTGGVDVGSISNGNAGRFTNAFLVYDLPFVFKSYDAMLQSMDGPIGRKATEQFEKDLGVKALWVMSNGSGRDVQTRSKLAKTPADIKGLKIRVVSTPVELAIFKAWGANPTPVDWAQTYAALQQGVVDGVEVSIEGVLSSKLYEVLKYNTRLDYSMLFNTAYINAKKFASLSPQHQKILLEAAAEAKAWDYKNAAQVVRDVVTELTTKHGVTVYTPTPQEFAQWTASREQVWETVAKEQAGKLDLNLARQLAQQ